MNDLTTSAEQAYQSGDCGSAIRLYQKISDAQETSLDEQSRATFRIAYCHYSLGESELAERHFQKYLKTYPKDEEARLRYAESLFQQGKWDRVIQSASQGRGSWSKGEVELLVGRSFLELKEPDRAIFHFNQVPSGQSLEGTTQYWWAVAEYQKGNRIASRTRFENAMRVRDSVDWIKTYSKDWIRQINRDLRVLQGSLTFGFFYDGNLSYTSTQTVSSITGQPLYYSPNESSYIKDRGFLLNTKLGGVLKESFPWTVSYTLEATAPYYLNQPSYDNEMIGGTITFNYTKNSQTRFSFEARYLDSRYHYQYYQDFLTLTPGLSWNPSSKLNFYLYAPYTAYLLTRDLTLLNPSLTAKYQILPPLSISAGVSFSYSRGKQASYANTSPSYVTDGTMFSNFTTLGAQTGFGLQLPKGFYLSAQAGLYRTQYASESAPITVGQTASPARLDQLFLCSADLYYEWIKDRVSFDLSYSQFQNTSSGFQGIAYSTSMSTYNYSRPYALFTTTLQF